MVGATTIAQGLVTLSLTLILMWTERGPREVGVQRYRTVCNSEHVPMEVASLCQGWFKAIGVLVSPEHSLLSFWWQQSLTVAIPVHTLGMSRRHGLNRTDHPMYSIYNIQLFDLLTLNKTTINWIKDQFDDVLNFNKSTFTQLLYFIFESLTIHGFVSNFTLAQARPWKAVF